MYINIQIYRHASIYMYTYITTYVYTHIDNIIIPLRPIHLPSLSEGNDKKIQTYVYIYIHIHVYIDMYT